MDARKINQFAINAFLAANEMPLDFHEDIFATKRIDQELRAIFCVLGSTGCQPVAFGSLPDAISPRERRFVPSLRQAAANNRLAACASQSEERDQSLRKLRQFIPSHRAFS